jgi:predicted RNA binding protein YcfA (HicA-like mRNA interferase family)
VYARIELGKADGCDFEQGGERFFLGEHQVGRPVVRFGTRAVRAAKKVRKNIRNRIDGVDCMRTILRVSRRTKLLAKLANFQSDHNWTVEDLVLVLEWSGFSETGGRGSHRVFTHPAYDAALTIAAHGNAVKSGYAREVRAALTSLGHL